MKRRPDVEGSALTSTASAVSSLSKSVDATAWASIFHGLLRISAALGLVAGSSIAFAQAASGEYVPQRGQAGKDVVWIPTPDAVVDRMLQMAEVSATDRVFDLGSGDGKIAITAARKHGARATGLEYNPDMVQLSQRLVQQANLADKVNIQQADIFVTDFSSASVVTMYLLPQLNLRLRPILFNMRPGTRIVSHSFDMGDWAPDEMANVGSAQVYFWRIPANVSGQWRLSAPKLSNAPQGVAFSQSYQVIQGNARFNNELTAGAVEPKLSGDSLTFSLRDPAGQWQRFFGKVQGDRITGTVVSAGGEPVPFEATRTERGAPIVSTSATALEMRRPQYIAIHGD